MVSISTVFIEAVKRSCVYAGVPKFFEIMKWNSPCQRNVAIIVGVITKLLTLFAIDGSIVYALTVNPFNGTQKATCKVMLLIGLVVINIGDILTNMGTVWSEYDREQKRIAEQLDQRQQREQERQQEQLLREQERQQEQQQREQRHNQLLAVFASGLQNNSEATQEAIRNYNEHLFQQHKNHIIQEIFNLDVSYRYDPLNHITNRERMQRQLTE